MTRPRGHNSTSGQPADPLLYRTVLDDGDMLVVDKLCGVSVLADRTGAPCLWDALKRDLLPGRPYLVHRIDKGTSGLLIVARHARAQARLTREFAQRRVQKYYLARLCGRLDASGTGAIDLPLRKGRKSRYRVAGPRSAIRHDDRTWTLYEPEPGGHDSLTLFRVLRHEPTTTLVLARPHTGRTHQLRVHFAWIGCPILGDGLYGRPDAAGQRADRLHLHCHKLVIGGRTLTASPDPRLLAPPGGGAWA